MHIVLLGLLLPISWTEQFTNELVSELEVDYLLPRSRQKLEKDPVLINSTKIQMDGQDGIMEIENLVSHHSLVKRNVMYPIISVMMIDVIASEADIMMAVGYSRTKRGAEESSLVFRTSEYHFGIKRAIMDNITIILDVVPSQEHRSVNQMRGLTSTETKLKVEYEESGHTLQSNDGYTWTGRDTTIILHRSKRGQYILSIIRFL